MNYQNIITIEPGKRKNDNVIWEIAKQQDYIIVTQDSDFNELLILKGFPPKVIWIRLLGLL